MLAQSHPAFGVHSAAFRFCDAAAADTDAAAAVCAAYLTK